MMGYGVDFDALSEVSLRGLRAYLVSQGWNEVDEYGDAGSIYVHSESAQEILLPFSPLADYSRRVFDVVEALSLFEERDARAVIRDVSLSEFDLVRVRVPESDLKGLIPVSMGVGLFQSSRNLLLAAACSASRPQRAFRAGRVQRAVEYMDGVRFGQTEVGSFVVSLLSPVPPSLEGRSGRDWGFSHDPFSRRVTRKLVSGLDSARKAVTSVDHGGDIEAFERGVRDGMSSNLCDAIVGLLSNDGQQWLDVSVSWSLTREPPGPRAQVVFRDSDAAVLEEASRILRERQERPDERLSGYVHSLARARDQHRGRVILKAVVDGVMSSVRVDFSPPDYSRITEAHDSRMVVSLEGDLRREGQRWVLDNPRDVEVEFADYD